MHGANREGAWDDAEVRAVFSADTRDLQRNLGAGNLFIDSERHRLINLGMLYADTIMERGLKFDATERRNIYDLAIVAELVDRYHERAPSFGDMFMAAYLCTGTFRFRLFELVSARSKPLGNA